MSETPFYFEKHRSEYEDPYVDLVSFVSEHFTSIVVAIMSMIAAIAVLSRKKESKVARKTLKKTVENQTHEPISLHPDVDYSKCAGCSACTRACPEGEILQMIDHKAVLVSPGKCVGHGECERACPTGAITLVFGSKTRGMDIPRITANYETNVHGLYIAGELGGMGLIRNAVKQGTLAARHAISQLGMSSATGDVDLLIIGAGPAGLSAALVAIESKRTYLCIDQNSIGGTVANFPRQKIIMTYPVELPLVGRMKFKHNRVSKDELMRYWEGIRALTGLRVQSATRFETLERDSRGLFHVKTTRGVIKARKVILSIGVRGTPRKLGVIGEDLPKVTYNLIEPEQYRRQQVAVVGGGNAGVEAAMLLAQSEYQNEVSLLIRGKTFDRCNEENQRKVESMAARGRIKIQFETTVDRIEKDHLVIKGPKGTIKLPNDFLFIYAGAELPHKFLMGLGIKMDKKFGEALKTG